MARGGRAGGHTERQRPHLHVVRTRWQTHTQHGVKLYACSTIAENFLGKNEKLIDGFKLSGLAQWLESIHNSDKYIEFS